MIDNQQRWEEITKEGEEYLDFEKVMNKRSLRADVHAFLLLDELFPKRGFLISAAAHDQIFLDYSEAEIAKLSDEQIVELSLCGVMYGEEGGLSLYA